MELTYGSIGIAIFALAVAVYDSKLFAKVTRNQLFALMVGLCGAAIYWYYLMLLTMDQIEIGLSQILGLALALSVSFLSWARFVLTTAGHVAK
jgi:hypothetical protein